jgi:hypothetical protein
MDANALVPNLPGGEGWNDFFLHSVLKGELRGTTRDG